MAVETSARVVNAAALVQTTRTAAETATAATVLASTEAADAETVWATLRVAVDQAKSALEKVELEAAEACITAEQLKTTFRELEHSKGVTHSSASAAVTAHLQACKAAEIAQQQAELTVTACEAATERARLAQQQMTEAERALREAQIQCEMASDRVSTASVHYLLDQQRVANAILFQNLKDELLAEMEKRSRRAPTPPTPPPAAATAAEAPPAAAAALPAKKRLAAAKPAAADDDDDTDSYDTSSHPAAAPSAEDDNDASSFCVPNSTIAEKETHTLRLKAAAMWMADQGKENKLGSEAIKNVLVKVHNNHLPAATADATTYFELIQICHMHISGKKGTLFEKIIQQVTLSSLCSSSCSYDIIIMQLTQINDKFPMNAMLVIPAMHLLKFEDRNEAITSAFSHDRDSVERHFMALSTLLQHFSEAPAFGYLEVFFFFLAHYYYYVICVLIIRWSRFYAPSRSSLHCSYPST
jgi:hypothetical protein